MKKLTFTMGFIGALVISASAQYFHVPNLNPGATELLPKGDSLTFYPKFKHQFSDRIYSPSRYQKPENKPLEEKGLTYYRRGNMPNLQPEGMFFLRIVKPDESVNHSLIVVPSKSGLKFRISNGLSEELKKKQPEIKQPGKE